MEPHEQGWIKSATALVVTWMLLPSAQQRRDLGPTGAGHEHRRCC
jgi:hypothetical protein